MATDPSIEPLTRAHADLMSAYAEAADGDADGSADLYAHLRIAQALTNERDDLPAALSSAGDPLSPPSFPDTRNPAASLDAVLGDGSVSLGNDPLGRLYEATRDEADRRGHGQFYTPMPVAEAAAEWAIAGVGDRLSVLDPGAGSGSFLVAAARALRHRSVEPADARLVGVDLKRIPLELARHRLALADGYHAGFTSINTSFFDLEPGARPPAGTQLDDATDAPPVGQFDAVIGNPPFVRGESLADDAEHYRAHLASFGPAGRTPYLDGDQAISRRSDAYVYFVTQATRFLTPGGRLAFVLPTKWLMSDYGEHLQRFLFDHYAVNAVVDLGTAFDDALVETCLLLATREVDGESRNDATVRFVTGSPDDPVPIERPTDGATGRDIGAVSRPQGTLDPGKLDRFFTAPEWLLDLDDTDGIVSLESVAAVSRGVMTGANRFFFVDRSDRTRWDIESRFLTPAVKSLREIDTPALTESDIHRWLIDVNPYVSTRADEPTADSVVTDLANDGFDGIVEYLEHAEAEGWHDGRTCRQRPVWFDLGDLPTPDAFVPKLLRERLFVIRNRAGATPSNAIDCITAAGGVDPDVLVALLNTSLVRASMEVRGRNEAGMLQLMTYETAGLPIPDPRRIPGADRRALVDAFEAFVDGADGAKRTLDRIALESVDVAVDGRTVRTAADRLRRDRLDS